jgi:hypothetical protein
LLSEHGISHSEPAGSAAPVEKAKPENDRSAVKQASDPEAKIGSFRSRFRGREDVYAVHWEAPDGRAGYMPRADRDRKTRKCWPLTDEVIRKHLIGELTVGNYPLLLDETCWSLAVDCDKKNSHFDAA